MKKLIPIVLISLLAITACTQKAIYNVENEPVPTDNSGDPPAIDTVEKAIILGCRGKGWIPRKVSDGLIEARIRVRDHKATVEITYDDSTYSIQYKSSENLKYKDGQIHRNYNRWVNNLDQSIQIELNTSILAY